MLKDELPDDLLEFLQSDRRLAYDAAACEIGAFTLRALDEIEEIELLISAESDDGVCVMRGLDLVKTCGEYDPRGMLVYIPSLRKYGSYDAEKKSLITYRDMSWSDFCADPARYVNAGWIDDSEIAEETFDEKSVDRIVEACSTANAAEAGFLCSILAEKGIRAESVGDSLGNAAGLLPVGETIAPRVWVREGDAGRAREIAEEWINRHRKVAASAGQNGPDDEEDVVFLCQECRHVIGFPSERRGHVETCPACGNYVDVPDAAADLRPLEVEEVELEELEVLPDDDATPETRKTT